MLCRSGDGRWLLPVSITVHHGLMDGVQVARDQERLEEIFAG
jgi:chloramphenicol O-acetyltransferase